MPMIVSRVSSTSDAGKVPGAAGEPGARATAMRATASEASSAADGEVGQAGRHGIEAGDGIGLLQVERGDAGEPGAVADAQPRPGRLVAGGISADAVCRDAHQVVAQLLGRRQAR